MNNIWIATDWHLWNTEYDDGRHKFKSITRLGQLADEYTSVIGTNDLFIHLGDLCDPSNTKPEKLKAIIQSIPGTKILCRGNHDTEPDEYYLAAGFDHVCEILVIHDLVFSHKPVNVGVDQINIHGHLHTRKLSTLDGRYLNAYDVNYSDKPVLLEDLLQHAVQQTKADYTDTEFKQDKVDKMFDSIDNDHYENILNLSDEFDLEQQLIQENETYRQMLKDNSIDTGINIHDLMEASIAPMLHSLSATEIEKDDRLDEVIYNDEEDEELTESYTKIRNINGSNYIEIDTSFIPSEIKASNVSSAVIMAKDILDEMMNTAPEMLLDIEFDTIKTSEDLVHALAETMNTAYTNEPNRRYDNFNVGITSIFSLVLNTGVNNEADIVKILGDIIPQENLKDAIDRTLAELDALEHITSAMILSNVKRIGIDLGIRKNRINTVKELLKKSDKIIKTVTDRNNTIQAYEYDYRPYNIDCRVFISGDSFIKPKMVSSEVDIDPARLYSRATKYDYIIVSHGIDDNDPRFTIQPIVINGTRYDTVEDAVYALFNIKNNPRILVLGCNEKSVKLKKKYNKFVDYADMVVISESAVAYSDNEELNTLLESAKLMLKTKMKDIKRAKKQVLRLLKNLNLDKYNNDLFSKNKIELIGYKSYNKLAKHQFGDITLNEVRLCDAIDVTESLFVFLGTCVYYTTILMDVFKNMNNGITITEGYSWRYRRDSLITTSGADIVFPLAGLRYSNMNECLDNYQLFKDCYYNESGLYAWMSIGENSVKLFDENDPMDEVVFEDPEDTIYWEQDDDNPKLYKEKEPMAEAIGAAVMTGMTIASGVMSTAKTINDWYKKNDITEYVIFNASENKMYKCIDNTYKFEKTAEMAEKQVDKTFVFLRTSNNLDKKQTERYNTARKYWSKVKSEHKKATKNESIDLCEEVTLTAEHLAELHKAHPELSTILPDDGKDIHDPTKYYCSKVWMQNENVVATASIRYPQANAAHYSEIQDINISEGYESYTNSIMNRVNELYDSRITESVMISTTDPVDIYDYKYEVLEEATKGSDILYPVYVILTNSGHASISFNAELKTMYTFGMEQEDNAGFGFDVKSINDNHDDNTLYSVYCVFVNQAQLKKLKDRVQYFVKHETDFLFDYPGIELIDTNISANSQHRWFCSRFVTDLLNIGSSNKKTQYITDDLSKTNFAHYICGGSIKNFKSSNIEAQTLRALEQEKNERILRDKKPLNIVQGLQEAASTLSPATRDDMNKLNAKWDLRPIGYGDRDKYIAEEEEKLKRMKEHDRKIKEMKDRNKQRIKAEKQAKKARKLKVKNEEVHDPFNVLDQERFFDWNDYHNTVLGESSFKLELEDKNFQFLMDMNESATGNNKLVPVFVILTHSHSAVSKLVQATTGDEYTHASISFDSSLTHMYTFGRTSDSSVLKGSFKIEDVSSAYYQNHTPPIPYSLFCIPVTEAQKNKMEKKVNYFAKNKNKFHFDFFGLFVNAMGIPNNPKNRYFCSRFVSVILNAGDPKNPLISEPSLQRPYSFAGDDYVRFVCSGENIALYDQVVADRIIKDIMRTEKLVRAQKSRVKNENFLGINSSDPFASDVLHYKFAMLDESGMDNFMRYLSSFKIQFDKEGNVIISRKEYDQLDKHFRESVRLCRTYSEAGNIEGIKEELAKVHYMIQLINKYYLSPNANKNPRMKSDIKKDMLDLRSVMLNHFNTYMKWITIREPQFNFQAYYDTSKYGNTNMVPAKVLTAVGKVLVTAL